MEKHDAILSCQPASPAARKKTSLQLPNVLTRRGFVSIRSSAHCLSRENLITEKFMDLRLNLKGTIFANACGSPYKRKGESYPDADFRSAQRRTVRAAGIDWYWSAFSMNANITCPQKKNQGEQQQGVIIKHNSEYLVLVWIFYNSVTFFRLIISFLLHCTRLAEPDRRLCARFHRLTAALLSVTFPLTPRGFRTHTSLCGSQAFVQKHGRVRPCEHLQVIFLPFLTPSGPIRQTPRPQFDLACAAFIWSKTYLRDLSTGWICEKLQ